VALADAFVRRVIALVLSQPVLKRTALRVALRFPGLLQRFKAQIKVVMVPDRVPEALTARPPPPSSQSSVVGPRFRSLILGEIARLDDTSKEGKR